MNFSFYSKTVKMYYCRSNLSVLGFEQKVEENIFSASICNSTTASCEPLGAHSPSSAIFRMIRRRIEHQAEEFCLELYYFLQDLRINGTSFPSLIRKYSYVKFLLLFCAISVVDYS